MADEENENASEDEGKGKSGGLIRMLVFAVVGIVVLVGAQIGTLIVAKSMMPDLIYPEWMMAMAPEPEPEMEEEEPPAPPVYTKMNPSIVVSYQNGDSVRFLQVTLEAMARDEESVLAFELHAPQIRNNLLMLFANESLDTLATIEGKEAIRRRSLEEVNNILEEESPGTEIEDVYFTGFVVQ